jgi:hypothetical protein
MAWLAFRVYPRQEQSLVKGNMMKNRLSTLLCILAIGTFSLETTRAAEADEAVEAAADILIARPLCFAATAVGSVLFVASLPFAIPSKSVKKSAHALVVQPGRATFTRPIGDFSSLPD